MEIDSKHRSNLYLNCNRTSSVYRCNNVSVKCQYQQLPTVTDLLYYTVAERNGPPKHVQITL